MFRWLCTCLGIPNLSLMRPLEKKSADAHEACEAKRVAHSWFSLIFLSHMAQCKSWASFLVECTFVKIGTALLVKHPTQCSVHYRISALWKLTPIVNSINVLRTHFSYKILVPKITRLCFGFKFFWRKNIVAKVLHKMSVKLTPCVDNEGRFYHIFFFCICKMV